MYNDRRLVKGLHPLKPLFLQIEYVKKLIAIPISFILIYLRFVMSLIKSPSTENIKMIESNSDAESLSKKDSKNAYFFTKIDGNNITINVYRKGEIIGCSDMRLVGNQCVLDGLDNYENGIIIGLGSFLLGKSEVVAKSLGASNMRLQDAAESFNYEKRGYKESTPGSSWLVKTLG